MEKAPKYYSTEDEFQCVHANLKCLLCPHCLQRGCLILHGYLYGYKDTDWVRRGHRIFCSNRDKRSGCGRTLSILKSRFIKHFMICSQALSLFLDKLLQGWCPASAFEEPAMHPSSVYRIYHRFRHSQAYIRTLLAKIKDPPDLSTIKDPVVQTIAHLKAVFKGCVVSQFQQYFQTSFL